jgi:hypothetical protein
MASAALEENSILQFFKSHPVLVLTFSAILCSAVGYWSEYSLLKQFGLNVVVFAEADDFFLAGLKTPRIFLFAFPMFAVGFAYISLRLNRLSREQIHAQTEEFELERMIERASIDGDEHRKQDFKLKQENAKKYFKEKLSSERRKASLMIIPILVISIVSIFGLLHFELEAHIQRIVKNPETMSIIQLRTGNTIPKENENPIVFITATDKFMFFYQHEDNKSISTIAVPIASISDVYYSKFVERDVTITSKKIKQDK